jgi:hypothetical protein
MPITKFSFCLLDDSGVGMKIENSNPFLLLEQISHTLHVQCRIWKEEKIALKRTFWHSASNKLMQSNLWNERLDVAISLSHVMAYLHNSK